jgi:D-xylose 1-dehydrogenase
VISAYDIRVNAKRHLMPDKLARTTMFFASGEACRCTNQQYVVDGGWV